MSVCMYVRAGYGYGVCVCAASLSMSLSLRGGVPSLLRLTCLLHRPLSVPL